MAVRFAAVASAALAAALAGCATTPPPQAVLEYPRKDCSATVDLSKASSLTPEKPKAAFVVTTPVNTETPCLSRAGGAGPYVLYALPTEIADKTLTVGSTLEGARLMSPDVALLDRQGQVVRTFQPEDYFFRGPVFSVQFKPRAGEAYVLVTSDPARIGKRYDSIQIGTSVTTIPVGTAAATWTSGVDNSVSRTFSYEGAVQAIVYDSDIKAKP